MKIRWSPSLLAAGASISPAIKMQIQSAMEMERAIAALAVVTPPYASRVVNEEVARRQRDLRMNVVTSHESVRDDLISGRWDPVP